MNRSPSGKRVALRFRIALEKTPKYQLCIDDLAPRVQRSKPSAVHYLEWQGPALRSDAKALSPFAPACEERAGPAQKVVHQCQTTRPRVLRFQDVPDELDQTCHHKSQYVLVFGPLS